MRILHRYILKQTLLAVTMVTGGFLFVMITGSLLKDPRAIRLPLPLLLEFMALLVPGLMPYVLPIGMLTGVLLVLGRMSAQNEITAMKSAGINLWRIAAPVVALGLAASVFAGFINFEYATWANARGRRILSESPAGMIVEKAPITGFEGFLVYVDSRDGNRLRDIWVWRQDKAGNISEFIRAESGEVLRLDESGAAALPVVVRNAVIERRRLRANSEEATTPPVLVTRVAEIRFELPLGDAAAGTNLAKKKLRHLTYDELMTVREKGWQVGPGASARDRARDRMAVQVQMQTHLAGAFGILSLTLLAIPLGIRVSRSETFVNFGLALALALTYYMLTVMVSWIRNPAMHPDLLVWVPNLVIQALAFRLLLKASKA